MLPVENHLRALIWDMGGVLVRNMDRSIRGRLAAPFGMSWLDLENLFFGNPVAQKASLGQATEADSWEYVRQQLGMNPEDMPAFIDMFWSCDKFDEDLYAFTMALKPRLKVALLSNAYPESRSSLGRRWPHFYNMFDVSIFSAEVGLVKPDPKIYHLVLDLLGIRAEEAVFVDDFVENIAGARAVGLKAIHFVEPRQTMDELTLMIEAS
jgi:glucose-1-phosphatase